MCIQLDVGFTGVSSFHKIYAGIMVAVNTFGYDILASGLITLVCATTTISTATTTTTVSSTTTSTSTTTTVTATTSTSSSSSTVVETVEGESEVQADSGEENKGQNYDLNIDSTNIDVKSIIRLKYEMVYIIYMIYRIWLLLCSYICAYIHRRHLMIWAVFAPKMLFEFVFCVVSGICHVVLYRICTDTIE